LLKTAENSHPNIDSWARSNMDEWDGNLERPRPEAVLLHDGREVALHLDLDRAPENVSTEKVPKDGCRGKTVLNRVTGRFRK
jgi:hypothetical protein